MPAYVVVQVSVNNSEPYERYKLLAPASITQHGGRYLVRGAPVETLEGTWHPSRFVILEFPTADAARTWWASEHYKPAKDIRQANADTEMILVEGIQPIP